MEPIITSRPRVCAVSYLNTVPLVWGMLHGSQRDVFDMSFAVPSACADRVAGGKADIGILPVAVLLEHPWTIYRGTGIACHGPVRSILLISRKPFAEIQVLAADSGSRSSVRLARVILAESHGVDPAILTMDPNLDTMLQVADAALLIGDSALRADPAALTASGLRVLDLGGEWVRISGLPMVFAVWAGASQFHNPPAEQAFIDSWRFGMEHIDEIVAGEHSRRGITAALAHDYLTRRIVFELGENEYRGMRQFLEAVRALGPARYLEPVSAAVEN